MFNHSNAMRAMATKYLQLAKDTKDPIERGKFFDYARLYAQLSAREEWRETSGPMAVRDVERRDVPERGDAPERGNVKAA